MVLHVDTVQKSFAKIQTCCLTNLTPSEAEVACHGTGQKTRLLYFYEKSQKEKLYNILNVCILY